MRGHWFARANQWVFTKRKQKKIELVARSDPIQQPVITETDSRLKRKLISIFCHRRWKVHRLMGKKFICRQSVKQKDASQWFVDEVALLLGPFINYVCTQDKGVTYLQTITSKLSGRVFLRAENVCNKIQLNPSNPFLNDNALSFIWLRGYEQCKPQCKLKGEGSQKSGKYANAI